MGFLPGRLASNTDQPTLAQQSLSTWRRFFNISGLTAFCFIRCQRLAPDFVLSPNLCFLPLMLAWLQFLFLGFVLGRLDVFYANGTTGVLRIHKNRWVITETPLYAAIGQFASRRFAREQPHLTIPGVVLMTIATVPAVPIHRCYLSSWASYYSFKVSA
jgi:hypothetical protein